MGCSFGPSPAPGPYIRTLGSVVITMSQTTHADSVRICGRIGQLIAELQRLSPPLSLAQAARECPHVPWLPESQWIPTAVRLFRPALFTKGSVNSSKGTTGQQTFHKGLPKLGKTSAPAYDANLACSCFTLEECEHLSGGGKQNNMLFMGLT